MPLAVARPKQWCAMILPRGYCPCSGGYLQNLSTALLCATSCRAVGAVMTSPGATVILVAHSHPALPGGPQLVIESRIGKASNILVNLMSFPRAFG